MMLCWAFFQSLLLSVLLLPLLFVLEGKVAEESERKKDQKWEESFQRYLTDLDSNLRLGHSLERSTAEAINSSTAFEEEKWMISELEMNVYVADVFQKLAEKKKIESLRQFSSALSSALQSGSNLHELVQNSIFQIQKKIRMEAEIKSMLTKVKYESSLLTALVPMMMIYMKTLSPNFKEVMYGSLQGRFVMLVCLAIYLAASYLCYYMTQIDI